jgi:hypothetical protein
MGNTARAVTRVICLWCGQDLRIGAIAGSNKKPRSCEQGSEASIVGRRTRTKI